MTIKKWCCIGFIVIFLLTLTIIIYAKSNFIYADYGDYSEKSLYGFIGSVNSNSDYSGGMNYENDLNLQDFFIDEEVSSLEDLIKLSDYILVIANEETPTFKGNGIINNTIILKVIKGEGLEENETVKIYDLLFHWDKLRTIYLGGNTPLQIGDEYIVFLKKTQRASVEDSFVFTSVKYGRISLLKERGILENYEQSSSAIVDILNYDFVFPENSNEEIKEYKKVVKEIREYAEKELN